MEKGFIPNHGNYQNLKSYQKSLIVYQGTQFFCNKFLGKFDRTVDQMIQAARSGKQNIIEGCMASATSKETEIKLVNVARASLEELLEDYYDHIRTKSESTWDKNSKEALFIRKLAYSNNEDYKTYQGYIESRESPIVANIMICLIHQCNFLLNRQIRALEQDFLQNGGLRERMSKARRNHRGF